MLSDAELSAETCSAVESASVSVSDADAAILRRTAAASVRVIESLALLK